MLKDYEKPLLLGEVFLFGYFCNWQSSMDD